MNKIVLLSVFTDFSNKMSKKAEKVCKVKGERFCNAEFKFFLQKNHPEKILDIVCIVHYAVKTLTLNIRAELTLLETSIVMLIKSHRNQKERNLELIQSF